MIFLHLIPGIHLIPEGHVALVEKYGKFERILRSGLNYVDIFTSSTKDLSNWNGIATKCNYLVELTQQKCETEKNLCHTKDHVMVHASAVINFRVIDPKKAVYEIDNLPDSLKDVCSKALRSQVGSIPFDDLFSNRKQISQKVMEEIAKKVNEWGIRLLGVEVGELNFDPDIAASMKKRRIAEAEEEACLAMAQTKRKESEIQAETERLQAESKANSLRIETAAKADCYQKIKECEIAHLKRLIKEVGKPEAVQMIIASQAAESFKILKNNTDKIILLPSDFKGMVKLQTYPTTA